MERRSLPPFEDDFARALLRSAEHDEPSQAAYGKVATALGVGIGVGASIPAAAAGAASLAGAGRWSSSVAAKVTAFAVSGALLVASGVALLSRESPAPSAAQPGRVDGARAAAPSLVPAPSPVSEARAPASVPSSAVAADATSEKAPAPNAALALKPPVPAIAADEASPPSVATQHKQHGRVRARALSASEAAAPAAPTSSLGDQVRSLDRARVALASGNANGALSEIAHYRKAYPNGVFLTEASVIEIEALAARGDRNLAASSASAFVAAHPDSPQAERLRSLVPAKKP